MKTDLVKTLLIKFPELRDDDFALILAHMAAELRERGAYSASMKEAFRELKRAHEKQWLSSFETITRGRRKCQEEDASLRGEKYYLRQAQADLFRQEMKK